MENDKFAREIRKTGFILESKISDCLQNHGWIVINNKYYEDDFEGSVREIDLLGYKVSEIKGINVYTVLLVSCKKSEENIWALLAKKIKVKNPNSNWQPLHAWSNSKAIAYELSKQDADKTYHQEVDGLGVKNALAIPEYEVFAFQEMNKVSGAPKNDKNIFGAVTSLMKAQAYEMGALSQRKKKQSLYQFNLVSVIDSKLYRLVVNEENIYQERIECEHYISRYIIKKSETFSRIRFSTSDYFEEILKEYSKLHEANCRYSEIITESFYKEIISDRSRINILIEEFKSKIFWPIARELRITLGINISKDNLGLWQSDDKGCVEIMLPCSGSALDMLNNNEKVKSRVKAALSEVYRYEGDFIFASDDIPF